MNEQNELNIVDLEKVEAQSTYTAMMTGTLLPDEEGEQ